MIDSIIVTAVGLLLVLLSIIKRPISTGYISSLIISLWPAYSVFMPSGAGLLILIFVLILVLKTVWLKQRAKTLAFPSVILFALSILILIRDFYDGNSLSNPLVLMAVSIIMFLVAGIGVGQLNRGFFEGFAIGASILAITEMVRVLSGGIQHAKAVSFDVNPIVLGQFMAIGALSALFCMRNGKKPFRIIQLAIMLTGILATGSRGPMVGLMVALVLIYLLWRSNETLILSNMIIRVAGLLYIVVVSVVILRIFSPDFLQEWWRLDDADGNTSSRWRAWTSAWDTFLTYPLFGAGSGNYYYGESAVAYGLPSYPHQMLLEVASEYGVIAAVLLIVVVLSVLFKSGLNGVPFVAVGVVTFSFSGSIGTSLVFGLCLALAQVAGSLKCEFKQEEEADIRSRKPIRISN